MEWTRSWCVTLRFEKVRQTGWAGWIIWHWVLTVKLCDALTLTVILQEIPQYLAKEKENPQDLWGKQCCGSSVHFLGWIQGGLDKAFIWLWKHNPAFSKPKHKDESNEKGQCEYELITCSVLMLYIEEHKVGSYLSPLQGYRLKSALKTSVKLWCVMCNFFLTL